MGKTKTRKSITKRMKLTRNKKLVRRAAGQDHFNARATGNQTRKKHATKNLHARDVKKLIKQI
ncbi:50S ribosomal protein L35 [Candidatus Azambacteria bacterium]|nr:50S ribosomal protein L35 [Candidatus Azambacteria bacterium]